MQLKLFAMKRTIFPAIDDNYQPKAENVITIKEYHSKTQKISRLLLSAQFVYPFVTFIVAFCVVTYCLFYNSGKKKLLVYEEKMKPDMMAKLMVIYTLSVIFSLFSFGMSITAVAHAKHRLDKTVRMWYTESKTLSLVPVFMLTGDTIVIFLLFVFTFFMIIECCACCESKLYYCLCKPFQFCKAHGFNMWVILCAYSIVFPLMNVAIHANHIIIAFIHGEEHALSIAIVYGILIFGNKQAILFCTKGLYIMIKKKKDNDNNNKKKKEGNEGDKKKKEDNDKIKGNEGNQKKKEDDDKINKEGNEGDIKGKEDDGNEGDQKKKEDDDKIKKEGNEGDQKKKEGDDKEGNEKDKKEGNEDNPKKSMKIMIINEGNIKWLFCIQFLLIFVLLVINALFVYVAAIFVIIPINNAIEQAPARLQLIYSSSLIAVLVGVSYFLFAKKRGPHEVKITQEQLATLIPPKLKHEKYDFTKQLNDIPQDETITQEQQDKLIQLIRSYRLRDHIIIKDSSP